jgi:hypothetical protein
MYKLLGPDGKEISRFFLSQDLQKVDPKNLQKELERGEYVVEEVLEEKKVDGQLYYLASFVGYPEPEWVNDSYSDKVRCMWTTGLSSYGRFLVRIFLSRRHYV